MDRPPLARTADRLVMLSPQQWRLVACRCSPDEPTVRDCAHRLGISEQTAKNHTTLILSKLGVKTFARAAMAVGYHEGWTDAVEARGMRASEV